MHTEIERSVSALLDWGAQELAHSRHVCQQAGMLQLTARELVLTFRSHRFQPILGASDEQARLSGRRLAEAQPLAGLTILIADDHRDTLDMFEAYLAALGATVLTADSVKAALASTETHVIDVALVDLRMSGGDGWCFLRELRESGTPSAQAPVYAVSGEYHDRHEPDLAAFAGYYLKPADLDILVSALKALPRRLA